MEVAHMSANKWVSLIQKHSSLEIETPPNEYQTAKQLGNQWNLQTTQTKRIISEMLGQDKIEMQKFRIRTGTKTYPVPHYKIK